MLRHSLAALRRALGAQLRAGACAELGSTSSSSSAAPLAAWQQQQQQWAQSRWHQHQQQQQRGFAGSSVGGIEGDQGASSSITVVSDGEGGRTLQVDLSKRTMLHTIGIDSVDDALAEWGRAMDAGEWERAWEVFEAVAPVDVDEGLDEFPTLEALTAWDPEEEAREARRQREADIQAAHAARWVRRVDRLGRARGVGKRKSSVAVVWIKAGAGLMMVNKKPYDQYFPALPRRNDLLAPFLVTDTLGSFDVMASCRGGGSMGQAQAVRHGLARALLAYHPPYRTALKGAGLLTRDARVVERKKPGLKKARKAFQWVKR